MSAVRRPKLDAFTGIIDQILREDQYRPKKQRHTAKRIGERLRAEYGFTGGDTIVKAYVREKRLGGQEMFVPLAHPPGDAQADFGEALVVIAGVECKAHYLVVDLPHSDDAFVKAFPAETTEAFCDGHNAAFRYFGGVPRRIVYDNTKLAVARILGDGTRQRTQVFSELQSHDLFDDRFGRPGKGNDKGKVEGLVGDARRNFFVPIPRFDSWDALNADLECQCRARRGRHRAEQVFSFVLGHILWIVGEHCLRTRGERWIVGVWKPRGWADRFACSQKPSGLLETSAWPHGWTEG